MKHELLQEAELLQPELSEWRQALHNIPETGIDLPHTVSFIKKQLDKIHIPYKVYDNCSCIVAQIGNGHNCFLLRSDMDALPIAEESIESFASSNGCMHACGHDLHAAILLGAAKLLKKHECKLSGTVRLLFQAGEEIFTGAKAAIDQGVLETPKVNAAFAMHVASTMSANRVIYGSYPMAAVYGFKITVTGRGTHGSTPHLGIDPINTGVHIYLALQELISQEVPASEEAVLTIGRFDAGAASNIIPERAILEGTLRTFKPELEQALIRRINEIISSISDTYRTNVKIEVLSSVPSVKCCDALNNEILSSITQLDDTIKPLSLYHVMGSEDFAFFSERVPASYFCLGAGVDDKSKWRGQHNPQVLFNENCLPLGAAIYAKAAMDWLSARGKEYQI